MSLESLVPSLALCQQLKPGDFPESVFCWAKRLVVVNTEEGWVDQKEERRIVLILTRDVYQADIVCMAPTLAEIGEKLPGILIEFMVDYAIVKLTVQKAADDIYDFVEDDENPSTAALRLWLRVNGREVKHV